MFLFRLLPWEYAIRNLFRRPLRTALTFAGLATVVLLVFVVVGFIRGLEKSLAVSGDPQTAIVFSLGMGQNLEYSSISMSTNDLVAASVEGIQSRYGQKYVSPELYLGTEIKVPGSDQPRFGLVRGVMPPVLLVRRHVQLDQGDWPKAGEVLVGRLAAKRLPAGAGAGLVCCAACRRSRCFCRAQHDVRCCHWPHPRAGNAANHRLRPPRDAGEPRAGRSSPRRRRQFVRDDDRIAV